MNKEASVDNIYRLDGKVPLEKAVPFGLQHILAMFVANIAPIIIVAGASGLDTSQSAKLIQSAMVIAGIGTLIQLFPLWKIGSGLPIVMGISSVFEYGNRFHAGARNIYNFPSGCAECFRTELRRRSISCGDYFESGAA